MRLVCSYQSHECEMGELGRERLLRRVSGAAPLGRPSCSVLVKEAARPERRHESVASDTLCPTVGITTPRRRPGGVIVLRASVKAGARHVCRVM